MIEELKVRKYQSEDREAIRAISVQTAFLEKANLFMDAHEILADCLTLYFTDYEPESCFVVESPKGVVGYLIGTKDIRQMNRILSRSIYPGIIGRLIFKGVLFKPMNFRLFLNFFLSFLKGELHIASRILKSYQATLHINVDKDFRSRHVGNLLVTAFLEYLKENHVSSVYASTLTQQAKSFFMKQGFEFLFESRRSYFRYRLGEDLMCYILGKRI